MVFQNNTTGMSHIDLFVTFIVGGLVQSAVLLWYVSRKDLKVELMWRVFAREHNLESNGKRKEENDK